MDKHDKKIVKDGDRLTDKQLKEVVGGIIKIPPKPIAHKQLVNLREVKGEELLNIILMILGIVIFIAGICYAVYLVDEDKNAKLSLIPIILGVLVFIGSFSFVIIPTGSSGVAVTFGQVAEQPLPNGFNVITPFCTSVQQIDNKYRLFTEEDKIWCETSDQVQVYCQGVQVTYQIMPDASAWIVANVNDYENNLLTKKLVDDAIKEGTRIVPAAQGTSREVVAPAIQEALQIVVDNVYGEDIVTVHNIANMNFLDEYSQAISQRQQAVINQEKQNIENETAIEKAKAEATVKKEEAQGIADANAIVQQSITDGVLQQKIIDKWNGEMPKYVGGDGGSFGIIDTMQNITGTGGEE